VSFVNGDTSAGCFGVVVDSSVCVGEFVFATQYTGIRVVPSEGKGAVDDALECVAVN
jgi:hypothetical protein